MEFGIFNLMGSRDPAKPTVEVFAEVAEQTRLADELGYAIAGFAEHHFSNYCLCASPLMLVVLPLCRTGDADQLRGSAGSSPAVG
jgi:alkanesulfonate monooxygenase SsuD/methylene tetrahydromethanopterin reductase-like flavin-dependent oxidoreductase (luciferase family)